MTAFGVATVDGEELEIEWDYCVYCRKAFTIGDPLALEELTCHDTGIVVTYAVHLTCQAPDAPIPDQDATMRDILTAIGKKDKWENTQ